MAFDGIINYYFSAVISKVVGFFSLGTYKIIKQDITKSICLWAKVYGKLDLTKKCMKNLNEYIGCIDCHVLLIIIHFFFYTQRTLILSLLCDLGWGSIKICIATNLYGLRPGTANKNPAYSIHSRKKKYVPYVMCYVSGVW